MLQRAADIFEAGGLVMYPLAAMSLLSVTLLIERAIYFLTSTDARAARKLEDALQYPARARASADAGETVYHRFCRVMLSGPAGPSDADASRALNDVRPQIERFNATLSTVITAAPLLGILGTVTGIIDSFGLLGQQDVVTDPTQLARGISQALYTTAFGLTIAVATLFPFAVVRAAGRRVITRLETLAICAQQPNAPPRPVEPGSPVEADRP